MGRGKDLEYVVGFLPFNCTWLEVGLDSYRGREVWSIALHRLQWREGKALDCKWVSFIQQDLAGGGCSLLQGEGGISQDFMPDWCQKSQYLANIALGNKTLINHKLFTLGNHKEWAHPGKMWLGKNSWKEFSLWLC